MKATAILMTFGFLVLSAPAWAATHHVDADGVGDFDSIGEAFAVASGGDTLPANHHDSLFTDPLFCDAGSDDFTVREDSPVIPDYNP